MKEGKRKKCRGFVCRMMWIMILLACTCMKFEGQNVLASGEVQKQVLNYSNGNRYEGEAVNNRPHGFGILYCANGNRYEGDWEDGKRQGQGTFYWTDGRRYEGDWTADEITGTGTMYYTDGSRYEGEWNKGYKNGKGTYYYFYGDYYKGEWKNGRKNGSGTLYKEDGTKIKGIWTDDVYSKKNAPAARNPVNFPVPKLSGIDRDDILRVAKSQLGYQGSPDGYSVYAAWAGQEGEWWCSEFIAWCANKAKIPKTVIPVGTGSGQYRRFYSQKGRYYIVRNNQDNSACGCKAMASKTISVKKIQPGDIVLFDTDGNFSGGPDHAALALSVSGNMVQTIDGNSGNKVTIRMRSADQIHGVCRPLYSKKLAVVQKISGLPSRITLKKGKKVQLKPVIRPAGAPQKAEYKSSNNKIAAVSANGKITAKKAGKAKITVKAGKKKVVIAVTVKK